MISTDDPKWIKPFSRLSEAQFARLVALVRRRGGDIQRDLSLAAAWGTGYCWWARHWSTSLTLRQVTPLFGLSKSAVECILDHLAPLLAISPARRPRKDTVDIVDGTLVPTRDRSIAASGENWRYSTNLQALIENSRVDVAIGLPLPGSRIGPSPSPASAGPVRAHQLSPTAATRAPACSSRTATA